MIDLNKCLIEATWNSAGLAGTGSNDIVVPTANIPPHRMLRVMGLRGALDDVIEGLTSRQSVTGADLAKATTVYNRIGHATALVDSAGALVEKIRAAVVEKGRAGEEFTMAERARYRLNLGHVAQNCCDAVDTLLPLTGGRGLETTHPMQRAWRDVHAVAQHIGLVWDVQTGLYGSVRLGYGSPDPKF